MAAKSRQGLAASARVRPADGAMSSIERPVIDGGAATEGKSHKMAREGADETGTYQRL